MAEEGKMSRAISKAGSGDRLSAAPPEDVAPEPASEVSEIVTAPQQAAASFRLVRGKCGEPDATLIMTHDKFGEAASQFRSVRARLLALNNGNPPRTITVTSASREEGKTTVAANLAVALSELGQGRVVVVDGDLVAPGLHELLNLDPQSGLNDILANDLELDGNVYETAVPNLDVVPAVPISEAQDLEGELSRSCGALLGRLREFYAYVIIDTPPVLAASQATTFAKHSDGVLLLARLERTPREVVKRATENIEHSGGNIIGCLLTHHKHHVPDFIYRFFGSTPKYYYSYSRSKGKADKHRR